MRNAAPEIPCYSRPSSAGANRQRGLRSAVMHHADAILGSGWVELATGPALANVRDCDLRALWDTLERRVKTDEDLRQLAARSPMGREQFLIATSFHELYLRASLPAPWDGVVPATLARMDAVPLCRFGVLMLMERGDWA